MSHSQVAGAVGLQATYALRFLSSSWLKDLPGQGDTDYDPTKIEVESDGQSRGQTRISPIPIEVAALFWIYQVWQRNREAIALAVSCARETLTRRADAVFGVARSEAEYQAATAEMMKLLGRVARERDVLLESYEIDDDARAIVSNLQAMLDSRDRRIEQLKDKIRELGGDVDE
jgi:hypothetical protein